MEELKIEYKGILIVYLEYTDKWIAKDNGEWGDSPTFNTLSEVKAWVDQKEKAEKVKEKKKIIPIIALKEIDFKNTYKKCKVTSYAGIHYNEKEYWITDEKGKRERTNITNLKKYDEEKYKIYQTKYSEMEKLREEIKNLFEPFDGSSLEITD